MNRIVALFIALLPFSAIAQEAGELKGFVLDDLNLAPLAGWTVEAITTTGTYSTETNDDGSFQIKPIAVGLCNVRAVSPEGNSHTIHEVEINSIAPTVLEIAVDRNVTLKEVSVAASAFKRTAETPLSIKNVGRAEMIRTPGAVMDLSKVVQSFPGVLPKPSFGYAVAMRGGAPNENAYVLDGIVLPTINHYSIQGASGGAISLVNMDHIQDMSLITGAFPADIGQVLSGVIKIEGRNPRTDRWGVKFTQGYTDYGLTFEGPVSDKTSLMISGRNSFSQHYFKLFGVPVLPAYQDGQLRLFHKIDQHQDITLIAIGGWDKYTLYNNGKGSDALLYNIGYIPEGEQSTEVIGTRYRLLRDNGRWEVTLSRDRITNSADKFIGNTNEEQDRQISYASSETNNRFNLSHHVIKDNWQWKYGVTAIHHSNDVDSWQLRYQYGGVDTTGIVANMGYLTLAGYTQLTRRYYDGRMTTSVGLRMEGHSINEHTQNPLNQISPRLSIQYNLNENWSIQTAAGQFQQLPPAVLMLANASNTQLEMSQTMNVQHIGGGIEYQNGQTYRFSLEGYYKDYSRMPYLSVDQISFAQAIGAYVAVGDQINAPTAQGRSYGVELFLQQKLKKTYWWMASYNLGFSETRATDADEWKYAVWDNRHHFNITVGKVWGKGWQIGAKWRYASGTPYTPFDIEASALRSNWDVLQRGVFDYSASTTERLAGFSAMDVRLDKSYHKKNYSLTWFLDFQNFTRAAFPLMPYLTVERDENGNPLVDPNDPNSYLVKLIASDTGRMIPTLGLILQF